MNLMKRKESDNVYTKYTYNLGYFEEYVLGDNSKFIQYEKGVKTTQIYTKNKTIEYREDNGKKLMCIRPLENENIEEYYEEDDYNDMEYNEEAYMPSLFEKTGFFNAISYGLKTKITTDNVDGKECYVITTSEGIEKEIQYVDKATNLIFKIVTTETSSKGEKLQETTTYEYSFGTVTAEDVKELESSEYTLLSEEEFDKYEYDIEE